MLLIRRYYGSHLPDLGKVVKYTWGTIPFVFQWHHRHTKTSSDTEPRKTIFEYLALNRLLRLSKQLLKKAH